MADLDKQYVLIQDNIITDGPMFLPNNYKNITGLHNSTTAELEALGWFIINEIIPSYDPITQYLDYGICSFDGSIVTRTINATDFDIETARNNKIDQITDLYWEKCKAGMMTSLGYYVDCAPEDINNWDLGLGLVSLTGQTEIVICDYYDHLHTVSITDYNTLAMEAGLYYQQLFGTKWTLRQLALNATTVAAIAAIQWP